MLVSAGGAGQLVLLAAMPVATRLYEPGDFGVAAVFGAIMSALLMISSLRYEMAIALPRTDEHAQVLVRLCVALTLIAGVLTLAAVAFWRGPIASLLGVPQLAPVLWLLPLAVVGAGVYRIFSFWAVRREAFGLIARTRVLQPLSNAAVQVILGVIHAGPVGLVAGQLAGTAVGGTSLARGARLWVYPRRVELRRWRTVARRYIRFPKFDVPAAFADTLSLQLPNLILASLFGPVIAGFYMLADRAIVVPLALLGQALGQVIYSRSRETVADGSMLTMVVRTVKVLGSGVALLAVFSVPLGPLLFATVFGEEWRGAGLYASILFLGFGAQFVFSSISVALPASGGQHLSLAVNAMLLAVKSAALYFGYIRGSALDAIIAYSAVTVAGNALAIAVVIAHLERCAPNAAASPTAVDL
jgi:O-antigen/teichoic acid export membrane protein